MASDKTIVLITGANSGIGYETVAALALDSPAYHILLGTRSLAKGQDALAAMRSTYTSRLQGSISALQIDVTDASSINAAKDAIEAAYGRLDVLINNAGIIVYDPAVDLLTGLRTTFETNVFGAMMVSEAMEPLLRRAARSPYLVYVSSDQGSIANRLDPGYKYVHLRGDAYRMSKAAINMLAACHRHNFGEWGASAWHSIRVERCRT